MRSWIIGGNADCDVVVESPLVSARHCQLTQSAQGFVLSDLGSTNGTYVNGVRIVGLIHLTKGDSITLGRTVAFPWPLELMTSIQIGRLADNDIVLNDVRVSGHHARLVIVPGFQTLLEDIGSSNGTFLNSPDRRVTSPTPITESDLVYFGTLAVPAAQLVRALPTFEPTAQAKSPAKPSVETGPGQTAAAPAFVFLRQNRWHLACLGQALILAAIIVLGLGGEPVGADWQRTTARTAPTAFALSLSALWLGCSLAIAEVAAGHGGVVRDGKRPVGLGLLCGVASAGVLAVVHRGCSLNGPWPAMWAILTTSALVGICFGVVISVFVHRWTGVASVLVVCFMVMIAFGGYFRPLPTMAPSVRLLTAAIPSRWAFEGLLLLEADRKPDPATSQDADVTPEHDLVEEFFPADSRMGPAAAATALASMLVGLAGLAVFISGPSRMVRAPL